MKIRQLMFVAVAAVAIAACGFGSAASSSQTTSLGAGAGQSGSATVKPRSASQTGYRPATTDNLPAPPVPLAGGTRIQRSARVTVQVANGRFDAKFDQLLALVGKAGGFISGSQAQSEDGQPMRSAEVTFQVPAEHFDETVNQLRQLGLPQRIDISGQDLSFQYVDVQARLRNAEAQRDAMLAILQQAKSTQDILAVQNQLGQITGQIEQLKGQIEFIQHATAFATVTVSLREAAAGTPRPADEWGFQAALDQGLHNLVAALNLAVVAVLTTGPFLLVLAGLGFWGWRWHRRARRELVAAPEA